MSRKVHAHCHANAMDFGMSLLELVSWRGTPTWKAFHLHSTQNHAQIKCMCHFFSNFIWLEIKMMLNKEEERKYHFLIRWEMMRVTLHPLPYSSNKITPILIETTYSTWFPNKPFFNLSDDLKSKLYTYVFTSWEVIWGCVACLERWPELWSMSESKKIDCNFFSNLEKAISFI